MRKITYTNKMKEQDKLWEDSKEDTLVMEELFNQIYAEAKSLGYDGIINIYQGPGEAIAEVYSNKEEREEAELNGLDVPIFGFCKPLIKHIEDRLEKLELINYVSNHSDLLEPAGINMEAFKDLVGLWLKDMMDDNGPSVHIISTFSKLEYLLAFISNTIKELNIDNVYDVICDNDLYIYYINDKKQYVLIQR